MLRDSISVNTKVCALQLKQKSFACVFHGILWNFSVATFYKTVEEEHPVTLLVSGFDFFQGSCS